MKMKAYNQYLFKRMVKIPKLDMKTLYLVYDSLLLS